LLVFEKHLKGGIDLKETLNYVKADLKIGPIVDKYANAELWSPS